MMAPRPYQYCYRCGGAAPAGFGLQCCCSACGTLGLQCRPATVSRQHLGAIQWPLLAVRDVCGELQPRAEAQAAASIHVR